MKSKGITKIQPTPDAPLLKVGKGWHKDKLKPYPEGVDISKLVDRTEFILLLSQLMQRFDRMDPDEKTAAAKWFSALWSTE